MHFVMPCPRAVDVLFFIIGVSRAVAEIRVNDEKTSREASGDLDFGGFYYACMLSMRFDVFMPGVKVEKCALGCFGRIHYALVNAMDSERDL